MGRRPGDRNISPVERLEIRRRVAAGEPIGRVAIGVGRLVRTIHRVIARDGGIPPRSRTRSTLRLSGAEREVDRWALAPEE